MKISERLQRRSNDDIIYIGSLVEKHCFKNGNESTEFLELIKALTEGRAEQEALMNKPDQSAQRILGRIEMAYRLINDLNQFVIDKEAINRPLSKEDESDPTPIANEPTLPERDLRIGGNIV